MDTCKNCGTSLIGAPIPENERELFGKATHFRREIALYDREKDMTVAFQCPDCGYRWGRIIDFPTLAAIFKKKNSASDLKRI